MVIALCEGTKLGLEVVGLLGCVFFLGAGMIMAAAMRDDPHWSFFAAAGLCLAAALLGSLADTRPFSDCYLQRVG